MNKHTPGPWTWADNYYGLFGSGQDNAVLKYASYEGMWLPEYEPQGKANARLIASAPELLETLKKADTYLTRGDASRTRIVQIIRTAIAKAETAE